MIVVDASVAFDAVLSTRVMQQIARRDPVAPPLMWSEVTSALREVAWRRLLSKDAAVEGLSRLSRAPIKRLSPKSLHHEAWLVAEELGWAKAYDAEYVALARLNRCRLLTRDARMQRAASHLVEIVGPTEI